MDGRPAPGEPATSGRLPSRSRPGQPVGLGLLLVLLGALLLAAQFVHIDLGHYGWPLFVIVPGVALLLLGITSRGAVGEGFMILGSITTVTGLILLYQNSTDHFESWAYAWALIFPASVGLGMILYGLLSARPGNVRVGMRLLGVGVILFLLGAAFFEGVLGIGGYDFGHSAGTVFAILIIAVGALLLILNIAGSRSRRSA